MKKLLLVLSIVLLASFLLAEVNFYGSARMTVFYDMKDKDLYSQESGYNYDRTFFTHTLQGNSRFGAKFSHDNLTGRFEVGTGVNLRLLYAEYDMGAFKLLVGQAGNSIYDNNGTTQVWGSDNTNWGYGSASGDRTPQLRITLPELMNLRIALLSPIVMDPAQLDGVDALLPVFDFSLEIPTGMLTLKPSFMFNMNSYNKDLSGIDESVMAYILNIRGDLEMGAIAASFDANFGQNTGDLGCWNATDNLAKWDASKNEIWNTSTFGFAGSGQFQVNEQLAAGAGFGFTSSNNADADWEQADTAMSLYVNVPYSLGKGLSITPEFGIVDEMEDSNKAKQGKNTYFGAKVQFDF
jgi:hypothetical protein